MPADPTSTFEQHLERYADLLVRVGVNLQPGQGLTVDAPIAAATLVRRIAAHAYDAGARLVDVRYNDEQLTRIRLEHAAATTLDAYPEWRVRATLDAMDHGHAFLSITGHDPDLLNGIDPERIAATSRAAAQHQRPILERRSNFDTPWSIGPMPAPAWARKVFPGMSDDDAVRALWDAIFTVTRADQPDPVAAWREHTADLAARRAHLDARRYAALHFHAPGTDLEVGLADDHTWAGGAITARTGIACVPNLPTDEVFTAPHRDRVNGVARATRPFTVRGTLIDGLEVRFENGRVVEARARTGLNVFETLLNTDEGARHLGEVALVPAGAPVARTGLLFYNTLFDENAASHIALGNAYPFTVRADTPEALASAGANTSAAHTDWMIGSAEMNVDGVHHDGTREPLMRDGEWAF